MPTNQTMIITHNTQKENFTIEELLKKYGSVQNIPLRLIVKICSDYNLFISGLGNGKVRLMRCDE